ncbi:MAG: Gfo/Idh/MocA family oxidoreductase [Planctomycetota bacterium]|jgi:predicted dehydrogenase|nr:Gfo/Idh/MocA family oxidoreductase [Planctomycetota bacterium]
MARSKPIRIGIVGLGMGKAHAMAAAGLPGVEIAAIAEPDSSRLEQLHNNIAKQHGAKAAAKAKQARLYDDYKAMARDGAVDGMILALPTDMHAAASRYCLKQGVHVLCEKPPTVKASEMAAVKKLAEDQNLTYMFCRQQRFDPKKFATRDLALAGKLGTIYHAESKWMRTRGVPFRGGWGVNKDSGGGVLLDLGIHQLDDAWFCMGSPKPVEVFAGLHCGMPHLAKGQKLSMPYNADDCTVGMVRFDTGATLMVTVTFALNEVKPDTEDGVIGNTEWFELKVLGSKAGIDVVRNRMVSDNPKGAKVGAIPVPAKLKKMRTQIGGQLANFTDAIRTGAQPLNTAEQALHLMQMLDALRKSSETGRSVRIK